MTVPYANYLKNLFTKKQLWIEFYHIPTGQSVKFRGSVTSFNDSFSQNWNSEEVYGRMDPVQTYQSTNRSIAIAWDVIAASCEEAGYNLQLVSQFARMQYPTYLDADVRTKGGNALAIASPPLMRMRFINWAQDTSAASANPQLEVADADDYKFKEMPPGSAAESGLVGVCSGFTYSPDFGSGFVDPLTGQLYPKRLEISIDFAVVHTTALGYNEQGVFRGKGFPYGTWSAKAAAVDPAVKKGQSVQGQATSEIARDVSNAGAATVSGGGGDLAHSMN
tara:strand:- start:5942 stop:6775 length:834 start_codon:yes stop_codon:yes gene_type:complete